MLTSEYFALDGALVLAVPTKPGQEFFFEENEDGKSVVFWEAFLQEKPWLQIEIDYKKWELISTNNQESAEFIVRILKIIQNLSNEKLQKDTSYILKTNLQFPANYGLGSSSTLMNNLAEWSGINPYELNSFSLGGSGYDVAVAHERSAVLFEKSDKKNIIKKVEYKPPFSDELIFIHLNQKQDSREGIRLYNSKEKSVELISEFTELTEAIFRTKKLEIFSELMTIHEHKLSEFLQLATVKYKYFSDCPVFIKSLGAWGGDFVMTRRFPNYQRYFLGKGFSTIFKWDELIY